MDSGAVGWLPQVKSWANKVSQKNLELSSILEKMILDFLNDALAVVKLCSQPLYLCYYYILELLIYVTKNEVCFRPKLSFQLA